MAISFQVTMDCLDTAAMAAFWAVALDYQLQPPPPGYATWDAFADEVGIPPAQRDALGAVVDPAGIGPRVLFQKVPEHRQVKNRVHLDLNAGAGIADEAERRAAVAARVQRCAREGARILGEHDGPTGHWVVMADPEGNEFCVQ